MSQSEENLNVFILTSEYQDIRGKNVLTFYGKSELLVPIKIIIDNVKPVFFVDHTLNKYVVSHYQPVLTLLKKSQPVD